MNDHEKLQLQKLIAANDSVDTTEQIRQVKHSLKIKDDIEKLYKLKLQHNQLLRQDKNTFNDIATQKCNFLYTNYTDIYHKMVNGNLNMKIFEQFLNVLHDIENGDIDQHEGSFKVGSLLKQIYIDSALSESAKRDEQTPSRNAGKHMNWRDFKLENRNKGKDTNWQNFKK
tara:strand:+ start:3648 stop:4160 length:513 start_codon:yes stop_codon:yes gene_type:complete